MATLKARLDAYEGQPEQAWSDRKSVSVGERGQKYIAQFLNSHPSAVYAIDGGIIKDLQIAKCDKLVLIDTTDHEDWFELFVELKGADISHAIDQIETTLKNPLFKDAAVKERQARIIGRKIPSNTGNSITEIAKKRFISKYQCRLKIISGPVTEKFSV